MQDVLTRNIARNARRLAVQAGPADADLIGTYGATPGLDCSAALQAFFNDPNARTLRIPYSAQSYNFGTAVIDTSTTDKHVFCDKGVIIRRTANITVVKSIAQFDWLESILGVSVSDSRIGEQDAGNTTPHNRLTIANARVVRRGSILKIVSDDVLLNAKPNFLPDLVTLSPNQRRKGEHALTAADATATNKQQTSGTTIILTAMLLDSYPTNPRVAKVNEKRFSWTGGKFIDNPGTSYTNMSEFGMIDCVGLIRPEVTDIEFEDVYGTCIRTTGSYAPLLLNIKGKNVHNQAISPALVFGYLINDVSSTGAVMSKLYGVDIRHVVTTNTSVSPVASGEGSNTVELIHEHGRTRQGLVSDSFGSGCSNGAFDTHAETDGYTFINCVAEGVFAGPSSGGPGFGVRGYNVTMNACRAVNCRNGFVLLGINNTNLINCEARGTRITGLDIEGSEDLAAGNRRITVRGGYYDGQDFPVTIGQAGGVVEVFLDGPTFAITGAGSGSKRVVGLTNTTVRGRNVRLDYTQYTATGASGVNAIQVLDDTVCMVAIDGLALIMPSPWTTDPARANLTMGNLVRATNPGNASTIRITGVQYSGELDFTGQNQNGNRFSIANFTNLTTGVSSACASGEKTVGAAPISSQSGFLRALDLGATGGSDLRVDLCADRLMLARVTSGSAVTVNALPLANRREGDILKVVNTNTNGGHSITFGTLTVAGGASATFAVVDGIWRAAN
jgi:hypothetical protein